MIHEIRQTALVQPGGIIELQSNELPVGQTVKIIILVAPPTSVGTTPVSTSHHPLANLSQEQRCAKIQAALSGWKNDPEIAEIFADIDRERHDYQGRPLAIFKQPLA
jgi:hypothetical protein